MKTQQLNDEKSGSLNQTSFFKVENANFSVKAPKKS